jgi:hypothetical protein
MQCIPRTDKEKESVRPKDAEFGRQTEPETATPRLAAKDLAQPDKPEEPPRISRSEKAKKLNQGQFGNPRNVSSGLVLV